MKPFSLEAKHLIPVKDDAFEKSVETKLLRQMIKHPETVIGALQSTPLRFSLIPKQRRSVRLGRYPVLVSA